MNKENYLQNLNIGITQGDLNGVSYELVIKTLEKEFMPYSTPVFFGTPKLVSYFRKICKSSNFNFNLVKDKVITCNKSNLVNIYSKEVKVNIGNMSSEAAELAVMSLDNAYEYAIDGYLDSIVCCPITKGLINTILPEFNSNSHYLASKFKVENSLRL
jgi:4-hydroxy-L-threonine phosphate dehydrogenase PdxA